MPILPPLRLKRRELLKIPEDQIFLYFQLGHSLRTESCSSQGRGLQFKALKQQKGPA